MGYSVPIVHCYHVKGTVVLATLDSDNLLSLYPRLGRASVPGFHFLGAVAALDQPHSQLQFVFFERHCQPASHGNGDGDGEGNKYIQYLNLYVRRSVRYETCLVPTCQPTVEAVNNANGAHSLKETAYMVMDQSVIHGID